MSEPPDAGTVMDLLGDESVRAILREASADPLSATELAERTDVSRQTIYRRLERLQEAGLVAERTRPRSDGHHDTVYEVRFERFEVDLVDGSFEAALDRERHSAADELTELWRNF